MIKDPIFLLSRKDHPIAMHSKIVDGAFDRQIEFPARVIEIPFFVLQQRHCTAYE